MEEWQWHGSAWLELLVGIPANDPTSARELSNFLGYKECLDWAGEHPK